MNRLAIDATSPTPDSASEQHQSFLFWSFLAASAAAFLAYSQTQAFGWDEGYHLLAAQLTKHGSRPYLDFCFPQTPLGVYWNAAWMSIFGESWRTVHAISSLCTSGAVALAAGFVRDRFPVPAWRLSAAFAVAVMVGANKMVVLFGATGQPYGLCLLLIVAAFRCAVSGRRGPLPRWSAGFLSGAAAATSLLTAPVAPVLLIWILLHTPPAGRRRTFLWFASGTLVSWLPVLWLFARAPRIVFFNVIGYMLRHRPAQWPGVLRHDLEVIFSWIDSPPVLVLACLAAAGFLLSNSATPPRWRAELHLCFWLAAIIAVFVSCARPTFPQYYLFALPFLAIPACAGLHAAASRFDPRQRSFFPVLALAAILYSGLAKRLYEEARDDFFWRDMQKLARLVDAVTPRGATLLAYDEHVYFLTRRRPPSGMEVEDSHGLDLPPAQAALFHVIPRDELNRRIEARLFDTVETCEEDDEVIQSLGLRRIYARSAVVTPCTVFWDKIPARAAPRR